MLSGIAGLNDQARRTSRSGSESICQTGHRRKCASCTLRWPDLYGGQSEYPLDLTSCKVHSNFTMNDDRAVFLSTG